MFYNFFTKKQYSLGIALTKATLALVELQKISNNIAIVNAKFIKISAQKIRLKNFNFHCNHAHIATPSINVLKKTISIPQELTKLDLTLLLELEQSIYFPDIKEKLQCDFLLQNTASKENNAIIYAIRKNTLQDYENLVKQIGAIPLSLGPNSHTLINLLETTIHFETEPNILLSEDLDQLEIILFNHAEILTEHTFPLKEIQQNAQILLLYLQELNNKYSQICFYSFNKAITTLIQQIVPAANLNITIINPLTKPAPAQMNLLTNTQLIIAYGLALRGLDEKY